MCSLGSRGRKAHQTGSPNRWVLDKEQIFLWEGGCQGFGWFWCLNGKTQQVLPLLTKPAPSYSQGSAMAAWVHSLPPPREAAHGQIISSPKMHSGSITFWPPVFSDSPSSTEYTAYSLCPSLSTRGPSYSLSSFALYPIPTYLNYPFSWTHLTIDLDFPITKILPVSLPLPEPCPRFPQTCLDHTQLFIRSTNIHWEPAMGWLDSSKEDKPLPSRSS